MLETRVRKGGGVPLDHMLAIMRDKSEDKYFRAQMAVAAAPYVHPRLSATEHAAKGGTGATFVMILPPDDT